MRPAKIALLGCLLVAALARPAAAQILDFRFIGNAAFEISDGDTTLLTDFPYEPGYGGYMYYPLREVKRRPFSLCLISHRHPDHFDPELIEKVGCTVMGPKEVTDQLIDLDVLPVEKDGGEVEFRTLKILPVPTDHAGIENYSYLVTWHGYRLYFTGDTEDYRHLGTIEDVDVLFITPWLARDALDNGVRLPGEKWVIYHHRGRVSLSKCPECLVPEQGDTFRLGLE